MLHSLASAKTGTLCQRMIIKYREEKGHPLEPGITKRHEKAEQYGRVERVSGLKEEILKLTEEKDEADIDELAAKLMSEDPDVEYAEADFEVRHTGFNDAEYGKQWAFLTGPGGSHIESALSNHASRGAGIRVAVIDTGITAHPDLDVNVIPGYDMISDSSRARDGNGRDPDASDMGDYEDSDCNWNGRLDDSSWHGTHVAGTVAALAGNGIGVVGVAPRASVQPIRVLGRCGGTTTDVTDGILWAAGLPVSGVPTNPTPAHVINLSLGGRRSCTSSSSYQAAVNAVRAVGVVVVVSAGNSQTNVAGFSPASCAGVISVAASNREGSLSWYSNYGAVTITAPGGGSSQQIYSTENSGSHGPSGPSYGYKMGTSMAAPHVAGLAALILAGNPEADVEEVLKSTASAFPPGSSCSTSRCGAGIMNAAAAVEAVGGGGMSHCTLDTSPSPCGAGTSHACAYAVQHPARLLAVAFSHNGTIATSAADKGVRVFDAATGTHIGTMPCAAGETVHDIAFSPNGSLVALAGAGGSVVVCDAETGELDVVLIDSNDTRTHTRRVHFSNDGRYVVSSGGGDATTRVFDMESANRMYPASVLPHHAREASFHGDEYLATVWGSDVSEMTSVWNLSGGASVADLPSGGAEVVVLSSAQSDLLRGMDDGSVHVSHWSGAAVGEGSVQNRFSVSLQSGVVYDSKFSSTGALVGAVGEGDVVVWDQDGNLVATLMGHSRSVLPSMDFSPDESHIATVSHDGILLVWRL